MTVSGAASAAASTPSGLSFLTHMTNVGTELSHSVLSNFWFQRLVLVLQTFAIPLMYYFRPLCTAFALFWYGTPLRVIFGLILTPP